ncbi:uncharacterized protein LOC18428793 isoform X2 [Amborella trichopoda]|uniref:uncharacterized protein LOC18428793 isoform X2 n=1 Tax=Amborella trichopoda TaxID=13333 RepID=UPI0009BF9B7E|nr:uncharacterized protein LOC18428793 isoform X2 [Amborella trichopoda]|eukprot:XP_020519567.1 uncharacterized protein LOC18428793 isoform X2 [Amborella trichopoda]
MDSKQLIDCLADHIALYHSSIPSSPNPNVRGSTNIRTPILSWFKTLTVAQRQAALTIVDHQWTQILLQMLHYLQFTSHGFFIILSDLPSSPSSILPTLCFRRSHGLLSRAYVADTSETQIQKSLLLFSSGEGSSDGKFLFHPNGSEKKILSHAIGEEGKFLSYGIDSVTVSEEFVANVDDFSIVMDKLSNGGFLTGKENGGSRWEELGWLKAKGYYSLGSFVANGVELALRASWTEKARKKGAKEKRGFGAGSTNNAFWRVKGCADWWKGLDFSVKKRVFDLVSSKCAKRLAKEIVNGKHTVLEVDTQFCTVSTTPQLKNSHFNTEFFSSIHPISASKMASSLAKLSNGLLLLEKLSVSGFAYENKIPDEEKLFFSTLGSVHSVSDYILRRVREVLMKLSTDCIRIDLLGDDNHKASANKCKGKSSNSTVYQKEKKGKGRNRRSMHVEVKAAEDDHLQHGRCKGHECRSVDREENSSNNGNMQNALSVGTHETNSMIGSGNLEDHLCHKTVVEEMSMEPIKKLVDPGVDAICKKRRKGRLKSKKKKSSSKNSDKNDGNEVHTVSNGKFSEGSNCFSQEKQEKILEPSTLNNDLVLDHSSVTEIRDVQGDISSFGSLLNPNGRVAKVPEGLVAPGEEGLASHKSGCIVSSLSPACVSNSLDPYQSVMPSGETAQPEKTEAENNNHHSFTHSIGSTSYEWPSVTHLRLPPRNARLPPDTDWLHLDVGRSWLKPHQLPTRNSARNASNEGGRSRVLSSCALPMSFDWPPMVRSMNSLASSFAYNFDPGFIPGLNSSFCPTFTMHGHQLDGVKNEDERKYFGATQDHHDKKHAQDQVDVNENYWVSEEESEFLPISARDYNQFFGGGVMYWNTADHIGTGFSRPPSMSSEDSSWAWHEAELNRAIDDIVGVPGLSGSYGTGGLSSPPAGSFCSPFDPMAPSLGYVMPGNETNGKVLQASSTAQEVPSEEKLSSSLTNSPVSVVEGITGDLLPCHILRPIVIPNPSRKGSRSEFMFNHDRKSPCIPRTMKEPSRIKRPPSPVVLCVPRAPRPPPPSPVDESRKQRGIPTVRSGSSSPRHWGMRSWYSDEAHSEKSHLRIDNAEVVWPSWRSKCLAGTSMIQPLAGALQDHLFSISQLALDHEHSPKLLNSPSLKASLSKMHGLLHEEIESFCKQVAAENQVKKPFINWAVNRVAHSLQVLWPRSRTKIFGSNATGLALPTSDVDLVVCLPPVRNLEPIKEAGILEGRNGIKETCLQHAARYLANQEWVKSDSLKVVENTAIPIIMLVAEVPRDLDNDNTSNCLLHSSKDGTHQLTDDHGMAADVYKSGSECSVPNCTENRPGDAGDRKSVRVDISFESSSHTGLQTTELVRELTGQFPAAIPLAMVLKQFLACRSLDHSYSGGLSSYCLVLLIIRFLQHEHHLGRLLNQNLGSFLMDFLYFFGSVFDPRQMRISIQGSGVYLSRERGPSIDPLHIDDPLYPTNNIGRNCFRILQCIKAFADAYSILEEEIVCLSADVSDGKSCRILSKIIPRIGQF